MTGARWRPRALGQTTTTTPYGNVRTIRSVPPGQTPRGHIVARWSTAHPHQTHQTITRASAKKAPPLLKSSPMPGAFQRRLRAEMFRGLKKSTVL